MNNIISRINESYDWIKSKAEAAYDYGAKQVIESFGYDDIFGNDNTISASFESSTLSSKVNFIAFLFYEFRSRVLMFK
jgi:hypothetical protein